MHILRLTAPLFVACSPFMLVGEGFSQAAVPNQMPATFSTSQRLTAAPDVLTIAQANVDGQPVGTSQSSYTSPSTNLQTPGANLQTPGANLQTPGTNFQTPGSNLQSPGVSSQSAGVGSQSQGVGSQSQGVGSQSTGVGSQSQGVGSQSQGVGSQSQGVGSQSVGVGSQSSGVSSQSQGVGSQSQGVGSQSQGVGSQPVGTTQTTNEQPIGATLPSSTKVPGAEQTFVNGRSTGTTQVAPPLTTPTDNSTVPSGANGTQVAPNTVLYPPQFTQGGGTVAPTAQPGAAPASTGTTPTRSQSAPSTAATRMAAPSAPLATPIQLQPGQGALDASLQQATCTQNWQQAIRLVNTAIAAAPASDAGYRTQLVSYRTRLQHLQSKGVRAPNWSQQCRSGSVANASGQ